MLSLLQEKLKIYYNNYNKSYIDKKVSFEKLDVLKKQEILIKL